MMETDRETEEEEVKESGPSTSWYSDANKKPNVNNRSI